ncbi:MAG TPA: hypothetical protein VFQ53_13580 [Kofleriaceae bacterium]|nr:hypothetical protein [Kofleriaceae bacterium]
MEQWADASQHLCGVLEDGVKQGRWRHWYDNGQLMSDVDYRAGHLVALTTWAPDGDLMQTARFENDLSDGTTVIFMPERHEQHFDAGERVGMWTIEYSDGRLDVRVYGQHSMLLAANGRPLPPPKEKLALSDGTVVRHGACERARVDNGGTSPCLDLFERVQRCSLVVDPTPCEHDAIACQEGG